MLMRIRFSGALGRAMTTATVAASSDRRMKKWETWKPWSAGALVEISELIVQSCAKRVLHRSLGGRRGRGVLASRPSHRDQPDKGGAGDADDIRQRPRETVQAFVERRRQHVLAAVIGDERRPHLVAVHALRQEPAELVALFFQSVTAGAHRTAVHGRAASAALAHDVSLELLPKLAPRDDGLRACDAGQQQKQEH